MDENRQHEELVCSVQQLSLSQYNSRPDGQERQEKVLYEGHDLREKEKGLERNPDKLSF